MARAHRTLGGVDTYFIACDPAVGFVSSSLVKQVAASGGDIADLLPTAVHDRLLKRLAEN